MAQLVSVLKAASGLSQSLFDHAQTAAFTDPERTAFQSDALAVVSSTQALAVSPGFGFDAPEYDQKLQRIDASVATSEAAMPGDAISIHQARLDVVQATAAMKAVTARPAVAVS